MKYESSFCVKLSGLVFFVGHGFLGAMQGAGLSAVNLSEVQRVERGALFRHAVSQHSPLAQSGKQQSNAGLVGHSGQQCLSAMNNQGESKQTLLAEIKAVHLSRQNQVIAAWLQLNLVGEAPHVVRKLEEADWGLAGSLFVRRVSGIVRVLKQFVNDKSFYFSLYKQIYSRVASEDRIVPGCGNTRKVLLDPERLERKMGGNGEHAVRLPQVNT